MVIAHSQQKEVIYVTKTLHGELKGKPLFITGAIRDQLHPALINAIWLEWARWRQTAPARKEVFFSIECDRDTEVWIIDDGDIATMFFPVER